MPDAVDCLTETRIVTNRRKELKVGCVISITSIVIIMGIIELSGYVWEKRTARGPLGWTLVASRRIKLEPHGSAERPYYLFVPNRTYEWEGIQVLINENGFRTEAFEIPKPDNTFRILNLGDSVVFGWEVRQEDTYGKQLERTLNKRDRSQHYEVINAGIPTWNLESERNFLLQEGIQYNPDLVILDLTIVNDIYGENLAVTEKWSVFKWLRDYTYGWPFLTTQARFALSRQQGPEAIPVLNPPKDANYYFPVAEDSPLWNRIWSFIEEMNQATIAHGADFVVVAFPTAFQLNSAAHPNIPQSVLGSMAVSAEIEFIDLLPIFHHACKEAGANACEGFENLLFADVWMHPNVLGHKLAAEEIEKVFLSP